MSENKRLINDFESLVAQYQEAKIEKFSYLEKMSPALELLYFFSNRIKEINIERIEISEEGITFVFKDGIRLLSNHFDKIGVLTFILSLGFYEEEERIIYEMVSDGDVIFDIGANIGWFTLNFAKKLKNAQIFAFEPMPTTYSNLLANIDKNGYDKTVIPNNFGFSDYSGKMQFYFCPSELSLASHQKITNSSEYQNIEVDVLTLDDFAQQKRISRLDFVKCDVEGGELRVIKGGRKTLKEFSPVLMLELYECWTQKFGYSPQHVIDELASLDYQCYLIDGNKLREIGSYEKDAKFCNENENNFFFLHQEKHKKLISRLV